MFMTGWFLYFFFLEIYSTAPARKTRPRFSYSPLWRGGPQAGVVLSYLFFLEMFHSASP